MGASCALNIQRIHTTGPTIKNKTVKILSIIKKKEALLLLLLLIQWLPGKEGIEEYEAHILAPLSLYFLLSKTKQQ